MRPPFHLSVKLNLKIVNIFVHGVGWLWPICVCPCIALSAAETRLRLDCVAFPSWELGHSWIEGKEVVDRDYYESKASATNETGNDLVRRSSNVSLSSNSGNWRTVAMTYPTASDVSVWLQSDICTWIAVLEVLGQCHKA
jgi:hypothetical protein